MGSLFTAAASFLEARSSGSRWLVRLENLDPPREVPGAASAILETLETFGFEWDGPVLEQSTRQDAYAAALAQLARAHLTFECSCSRTDLAQGSRYPGHCRSGPRKPGAATATRLKIDTGCIRFVDRIQGPRMQDLANDMGDVVLRRRDGPIAYLLAVVVDDAHQGITQVVRGADLLDQTPLQIHLQRLLAVSTPQYAHVPALLEPDGSKLAKSARSVRLDGVRAIPQLVYVLELLGLAPPASLVRSTLREIWAWALAHWNIDAVPKRQGLWLIDR